MVKVLVIETQRLVPIGTIASALVDAGAELVYWRTPEEEPPASLDGFTGVIALGGGANPDEDTRYPWLKTERDLLADAVGRRLPTLGLCLGGELLALVLGAAVTRLPRAEIGWHPLEQTAGSADDPLAAQLPQRFDVFHWHGYGFNLPPGARLLAGSTRNVAAFSFGGFAWGLQFHLEADEGIIEDWLDHYGPILRAQGFDPERLLDQTRRRAPPYRHHATAFAAAFAAVLQDASVRRLADVR